jgi:hypothetical protein
MDRVPPLYAKSLMQRHSLTLVVMISAIAFARTEPVGAQEPIPRSPQCTMPDTSVHQLPFSSASNADGARYVWFTNCRAGLPYAYVKTADIPRSTTFTEIDSTTPGGLRGGDVVWWPSFMGIVAGPSGPVVTAGARLELAELERKLGRPRFFRRIVAKQQSAGRIP